MAFAKTLLKIHHILIFSVSSQPNFPDFQIDPVLFGGNGLTSLNMKATTALGIFIGVGAGVFVVSSGLYDYMQHVDSLIE